MADAPKWWEAAPLVGTPSSAEVATPKTQEEHLDTAPSGLLGALMAGGSPYAAAPLTGSSRGRPASLEAPAAVAGGMVAGEGLALLPRGVRMLLSSILKFEAAKHGTKAVLDTAGVPASVSGPVSEGVGLATGGMGLVGTARGLLAKGATAGAEAAVPVVAEAAAPVAAKVATAGPKVATTAETMAEQMVTKITKLRTAHGMSEGQITNAVHDIYGLTVADAKLFTRAVLQSMPK